MSTHSRQKERFTSLSQFNILQEIGKGGYSKVYLVENKKTKRRYALKACFRMKNGKDRSDRTRTEIEVLKRLKHSNIMRLKGWFEDEDNIYLVLRYIPGKDCSKYFKHTLPDKTTVKSIMRQLVEAVKHCHQHGVVHRDIKLENILIDDNFKIKLTDFGLAGIKNDPYEVFSTNLGTVKYTAPEMIRGDGYNESVDIWGIGVVMFTLLTGTYPFEAKEKNSIFRRITERTIHYSKYNLERNEVKLLRKLLEKDPQKRIEIEEILDQPFFQE